jgi:hypothetical protein
VYFIERPCWQTWYFSYDCGAVHLGVRFHDRDRRYYVLPDRFRYGFERDRYYIRYRPRPRPDRDRYDYYRNLDRDRRERNPVQCEPNRRPTLPPATTRTRESGTRSRDMGLRDSGARPRDMGLRDSGTRGEPVRWDPPTYDRSGSNTARTREIGPRSDTRSRDMGPRDSGARPREISPRDSGTRSEPNRNSGWRSNNTGSRDRR